MTWTRLLWAGRLAARPARIGMGAAAVLILVIADRIPELWNKAGAGALRSWGTLAAADAAQAWEAIKRVDAPGFGKALFNTTVVVPRGLVGAAPISTIVTSVLALAGWSMLCSAICRGSAVEASLGDRLTMRETFRQSGGRWGAAVRAMLLPWIVFYLMLAILAGAGWVLLAFDSVRAIGALVMGLGLIGSFVAVATVLGLIAGGVMLVPAVACEGAGATDAIQRVYAYVFSKPARLVLHLAILFVQGVVCVGAAVMLAKLVGGGLLHVGTSLLNADVAHVLRSGQTQPGNAGGWQYETPIAILRFWMLLPELFAWGYAASYVCSAGTMLYLVMRRICDGQDIEELWQPGMVPGTRAPEELDEDDSEDGEG